MGVLTITRRWDESCPWLPMLRWYGCALVYRDGCMTVLMFVYLHLAFHCFSRKKNKWDYFNSEFIHSPLLDNVSHATHLGREACLHESVTWLCDVKIHDCKHATTRFLKCKFWLVSWEVPLSNQCCNPSQCSLLIITLKSTAKQTIQGKGSSWDHFSRRLFPTHSKTLSIVDAITNPELCTRFVFPLQLNSNPWFVLL